jgi:hypothetical protein
MISDDKHAEILSNYNDDWGSQKEVRDERIPELAFARWSQLDDKMNEACTTEFMGQFDIISRERKHVQAEFRQNEVDISFRSKKSDNDELDEIMQGKWRTDTRLSKAKQVFKLAQDDAMDCGFGAWRLHTEDTDPEDALNTEMEVTFSPIVEAIRCVFFDLNSKLYDKSDATRCSVITSYSESAYKKFLDDEGISEDEAGFSTFDSPYRSIYETYYGRKMNAPLYSMGNKSINLLEYYEISDEVEIIYQYTRTDEQGNNTVEAHPKDVAIEKGYGEPLNVKKMKGRVCKKYISNGVKILKESVVPGGNIPIIALYGDRNFIDGVENFAGIVKSAKDPQMLYNSAHNYIASLMMYSPVPKPIYDPREIEDFEEYNRPNDPEIAYMRKNKYYEENGQVYQFGQEYTQPAPVPPAVATLMQQLPTLMDSILNPGVTEDSFNSNMSGVALQQVKDQIGIMRFILLDHFGESMQRTAEVYASMVSATFDTKRNVVLTNPDGTTSMEVINENEFDFNRIEGVTKKDISSAKFNVYSKVGPTYATQREQEAATQREIYSNFADPNDPMAKLTLYSIISNSSGAGSEELAKAARFQALSMGMPGIEPQTEEEEQFVMQMQQQAAQQQEQPPLEAQILLMQEQTKQLQAQQAMLKEQNMAQANEIKAYQAQTGAQNDQANTMLKQFDSESKRMEVQVKAQEAGAKIGNTEMDTVKKGVDAQLAQADLAEKEMNLQIKNMPTEQLIQMMMGGANGGS